MDTGKVRALTEEAAKLMGQRDAVVGELKGIAADMWRSGLRNIREIGRRTGLSRTTLYAALRERGIEPTERSD